MRDRRWWLVLPFVVLALLVAGCGGDDEEAGDTSRRHDRAAGDGERHAPAEVGDAGPVRRLLRRARAGVLRGRGPERDDQAGRPGHRPRAGRARQPGRVRHQLARQHPRHARSGRRDREHRAGLRAVGHDGGDVEGHRPRLDREARGQEGRRLARRQRAQALRRADEERHRPAEGRRDRRAAVRHEPVPEPRGRRRRGDDLQRARAGARDEEPGLGRAVHARRAERAQDVRPRHRCARGRHLRPRGLDRRGGEPGHRRRGS